MAAAKAAGIAPQQPGNMTKQEARGDAGQEAVYNVMVDDTAFEVFYADVETPGGGLQNQPFYKGSEGRCLKMKLEGRDVHQGQGGEMELVWHGGDGTGRAPPRVEIEYRGGVRRRVVDFRVLGKLGKGLMTWQWSVQDGILAPCQGTKPQYASQDGASETPTDQGGAGLRGHGGGEGPRCSKDKWNQDREK